MSSAGQKSLLAATLSWLDNLPLPSASAVVSTKATAPNSFTLIKSDLSNELSFKVRPFYLADDYEDMVSSWSDSLYANQIQLMFGFKRWRRYSLKRAGKMAYGSQILARLPTWRAFICSATAIAKWKPFAIQRRRLRQLSYSKLRPLRKLLKIKKMILFWKIWARCCMRLRRDSFRSWSIFVKRVMKLRRLILWNKSKEYFGAWRRRARWPKVATQWQQFHIKQALRHWHVVSCQSTCTRRQQARCVGIARAYMLYVYVQSWKQYVHVQHIFQRQHQLLIEKHRQDIVHAWRTWVERTRGRVSHCSQLQRMRQFYHRKAARRLLDCLYDIHFYRRTVKYAASRCIARMKRRGLRAWYKHTHKHSIYNDQQQLVYKDSLLHYVGRSFQQLQGRVLYLKKQRLSNLAYCRSTKRVYLRLWRNSCRTPAQRRLMVAKAIKFHLFRAFWTLTIRIKQLKALRMKRRRQCRQACMHAYIVRYRRRILKVLPQKYSVERARQRCEIRRLWAAWQQWRQRATKHEQLRRLYNVFRFKQLAKGTFSSGANISKSSTFWGRGGAAFALFEQPDKDQREIQRRTLLVQIFFAWKLKFLPMRRKEKNLREKVAFKHQVHLCRRVLLCWHAVYEDVSAVRGALHRAVCRWWSCVVTGRYQRKLLAKHSIEYSGQFKLRRFLRRWRNRVLSHYQCMRSASLQKHYMLKEFSNMQQAVRKIQSAHYRHCINAHFHAWCLLYRGRLNSLRPIVTRIALRHLWSEWVSRYNDAVMHASLSMSQSQQPRRRLIERKGHPVVVEKENKENKAHGRQEHSVVLQKRQVDFSYTTIHLTSVHDEIIVSANLSNASIAVQPRTIDKKKLDRGYVRQFDKRKLVNGRDDALSGISFLS